MSQDAMEKAMNRVIDVFRIINVFDIIDGLNLTNFKIADLCVGYDKQVYVLLADYETGPEYKVVRIDVDWENAEVQEIVMHNWGQVDLVCHFFRPYQDGFLLMGARSMRISDEMVECNALIIKHDGKLVNRFCVGDGIADCITTADGRIIVSYFDEGIFGNYGWDDPIGKPGLIVWNGAGERIWENDSKKYDISDCYAMTIDSKNRTWFYYYTDFSLVCTDYENDFSVNPKVKGSKYLAISKLGKRILMAGGYHEDGYYMYDFDESIMGIGEREPVVFKSQQEEIGVSLCKSYGACVLLVREDGTLYGCNFDD